MGPVKEFRQRSAFFVPSSCFFVRSQARFFVPTRASLRPARAGAVKVGRRASLGTFSVPCQATPLQLRARRRD
jgi:hypothetical protein